MTAVPATELSVAEAIAAGELASPTRFRNSDLVLLRITGTGTAYRKSHDEFVFRSPITWLSVDMQRRVIGLPVIVGHPPTGLLSSQEFADRVVGTVLFAFVRGDDLWSVARILDANAAELIKEGVFDTSPACTFAQDSGAWVDLGDGQRLLVEAVPDLVDHIALIDTTDGNRGVWTRQGPSGVEVTTNSENQNE